MHNKRRLDMHRARPDSQVYINITLNYIETSQQKLASITNTLAPVTNKLTSITCAAAIFSASSFLLVEGKKMMSSIVVTNSSWTTHLISKELNSVLSCVISSRCKNEIRNKAWHGNGKYFIETL